MAAAYFYISEHSFRMIKMLGENNHIINRLDDCEFHHFKQDTIMISAIDGQVGCLVIEPTHPLYQRLRSIPEELLTMSFIENTFVPSSKPLYDYDVNECYQKAYQFMVRKRDKFPHFNSKYTEKSVPPKSQRPSVKQESTSTRDNYNTVEDIIPNLELNGSNIDVMVEIYDTGDLALHLAKTYRDASYTDMVEAVSESSMKGYDKTSLLVILATIMNERQHTQTFYGE